MKAIIFLRNYRKLNVGIGELYDPEKYKFFTICDDVGYKCYLEQDELKYFENIAHLSSFSYENIYQAVLQIRKSFHDLSMSFVTTRDQAVYEVGRLAFELGLEHTNLEQFVNKIVMKNKIANSIRIPKYIFLPVIERKVTDYNKINYECARIGYPLFAKPTLLASSQFTCKLNNESELFNWWGNIKNHPDIDFEIDEFIDGDLFHCDTFIKNGKFIYTQVSQYSRPCAEFLTGHPFGDIVIPDTDQKFNDLQEFAHKCLQILVPPNHGITHMEIFRKDNGEMIFLEVGARPPGGNLPLVYQKYLGVNVDKEHIMMNMDDGYVPNFKKGPYAAAISYPTRKGLVKKLNATNIKSHNNIYWFIKENDILDNAKDITNKAADIVIWNYDYDALLEDYNMLINHMVYEVES